MFNIIILKNLGADWTYLRNMLFYDMLYYIIGFSYDCIELYEKNLKVYYELKICVYTCVERQL